MKFTGELEGVTINITEKELSPEQLHKYREGRLKAAPVLFRCLRSL
jgi:hypothetical protein